MKIERSPLSDEAQSQIHAMMKSGEFTNVISTVISWRDEAMLTAAELDLPGAKVGYIQEAQKLRNQAATYQIFLQVVEELRKGERFGTIRILPTTEEEAKSKHITWLIHPTQPAT